jgi:hypothetical protein
VRRGTRLISHGQGECPEYHRGKSDETQDKVKVEDDD